MSSPSSETQNMPQAAMDEDRGVSSVVAACLASSSMLDCLTVTCTKHLKSNSKCLHWVSINKNEKKQLAAPVIEWKLIVLVGVSTENEMKSDLPMLQRQPPCYTKHCGIDAPWTMGGSPRQLPCGSVSTDDVRKPSGCVVYNSEVHTVLDSKNEFTCTMEITWYATHYDRTK